MATGIDLGSNSLRVIRIDCALEQKVGEYEKVIGTARGLEKRGIIEQEAVERICEALKEAKERIAFDLPLKAVATAAFRQAHNADEVIEEIKHCSNIEVEIISSEEECYYSARGVEFGLKQKGLDTQKFLMVDIGGGSTEVILKHRQELIFRSFPIGIVRAAQRYRSKDALIFGLKKELRAVKEFLSDIYEVFGKPKIFVGTGGTPATVAAMKLGMIYESYDARRVSGTTITREDIHKSYKKLIVLDAQQRAKIVGVGREEAIMAGLTILEELMDIAGFKEMVVSDVGVREGVALELCQKVAPK